jgi:site-specific DNA-methyltransferase (adenine-specific)
MEINKIYNIDVLQGMSKIQDNFIDCIITSPPYNLNINYENYNDNLDYNEYLLWVESWLKESLRILKIGGRICVNIPMENNLNNRKYIMNDYINIFQSLKYVTNSMVIWNKQNINSRTSWGSWKSPSCPFLINPLEVILIYSKETRKKEGKLENIDITKEEFIKYSLAVWDMQHESNRDHPAPYPEELPYRCMKMFTYQNDVILDPFMGLGTTVVVSLKNKRNYIGFDLSKKYCDIAQKKLQSINYNWVF